MKRTISIILIAVVIIIASSASYIVGYVKGTDDAFLFSATSELMTGYTYYKQIEKSEADSLPLFIKRDLEVAVAKATDSKQKRDFPFGFYNRFSFLRNSDVGSEQWEQKSAEYIQKAELIIKQGDNP